MKRAFFVVTFALLVCATVFANPFCGKWQLAGTENVVLVVEESQFTSYQNGEVVSDRSGTYTASDSVLTTNGVTWLYYFFDPNHFGLVGWLELNGTVQPVLMVWVRIMPERQDG